MSEKLLVIRREQYKDLKDTLEFVAKKSTRKRERLLAKRLLHELDYTNWYTLGRDYRQVIISQGELKFLKDLSDVFLLDLGIQ